MKVWRGEGDFLALLKADPDVRKHLSEAELEGQFRPRLPLQARRHDLPAGVRQGLLTRSHSPVAGRPDFSYQRAVPTAPTILVFDSGLGGLTVFREVAKARPDARYRLRRRRRLLSLWRRTARPSWSSAWSRYGRTDRGAPARSRGHRLQHRLDAGAAASARALSRCRSSARCRRSSRPARRRVTQARVGARHPGDREPRIYPRADPRFRQRRRRHAGRLGASRGARRGRAARRAGRRCGRRARDRALLRR